MLIDEGAGVGEHVRTTFDVVFPRVAAGGVYAMRTCERAIGSPTADSIEVAVMLIRGSVPPWAHDNGRAPAPT